MIRREINTKNTIYLVREVSVKNFQVILYNYATGSTLAIKAKKLRTEACAHEFIDWLRETEKQAA